MKRWWFVFCVMITAALAFVYAFIPNVITIEGKQDIQVTQQGFYRLLINKDSIKKWWPGTHAKGDLVYNNNSYQFVNNNISLFAVPITTGNATYNTSLYIVSLASDSVRLAWLGETTSSYNPVKRFTLWFKAKKINDDINFLLKKMNQFYSNDENIYGIKVQKALVMDSILIATSAYSKEYPSVDFIYSQVDKLKNYALANGAKQTGYPVLNIEKTDSTDYYVRVAIPLNRPLPDAPGINNKRMLGLGNILVAEVTGGIAKTNQAFEQIALYAGDHQRVAPAIPFYSLITDRRAEKDSLKWVTRIYFPVM